MRRFLALTKALSDASRVRVLMCLQDGELCVCQIMELLGLAPSTVSKHMAILHQAGLVDSHKEGRWVYYRLPATRDPVVRGAIRWARQSLAANEQVLADAREAMAAYFGDEDFESTLGNSLSVMRVRRFEEVRPNIWRDEFGVEWDRTLDRDIGKVRRPLITPETLDDYEFPDADDPTLYAAFEAGAAQTGDTLAVGKFSYLLFERAWSLVGMEDLLVYMLTDKAFVHELLDRIVAYNLAALDKVCRTWNVDAIFFGDDWGDQRGLIMGPDLWREFFRPQVAKLFGEARNRGKLVFLHSCGRVQELFDDLIECGLDVFNPFQPEVMDVFEMKRRYAGRLSFYGGISVQRTLPLGSAADTKDEVRRLLDKVGASGGYLAAPAHAVPPDAKPENVAAMIEVLQNQ